MARGLRWGLAVAVAAACALVGACGGSSGGGGTSGGGGSTKPATLKVGVIPIADVAPLYLGIQKGFFKQENLTIKPVLAAGGAAIVPAVIAGDDQIGFSNTTSVIIAASKKLPIQIIASGVLGGTGPKDAWDGLIVKKNSSIRTAKDLEGKTVAVNTLNNVGQLTINTALAKQGVDYKKVKYVEVEFPDMNAALDAGRVDAAWVVEPFYSQGKAGGDRTIFNPYEQTARHLVVATYFTSKQYIAQHRDVVDRFRRAINKSMVYAAKHSPAVRKVVLTYTKIPPKAAQAMTLPQWNPSLNEPTVKTTIVLAKKYGLASSAPAENQLILK